MSGFLTAASTNARNHATVLLLKNPNAHVPHLMSPTVLVGRALSPRHPPLRDLSIHSPPLRSPPHLHIPMFEMPHCALPTMHYRDHEPVQVWRERSAVFPATKSRAAVLLTTQQKRARSSAIAHAPFSAPVVDINVVGGVVLLRLELLPRLRRERNASGKGREMAMGMGLGKSRGDCA